MIEGSKVSESCLLNLMAFTDLRLRPSQVELLEIVLEAIHYRVTLIRHKRLLRIWLKLLVWVFFACVSRLIIHLVGLWVRNERLDFMNILEARLLLLFILCLFRLLNWLGLLVLLKVFMLSFWLVRNQVGERMILTFELDLNLVLHNQNEIFEFGISQPG